MITAMCSSVIYDLCAVGVDCWIHCVSVGST